MCLAIPSKIISIDPDLAMGVIDTMGVSRAANLSLLDEEVQVGDWVLVHVGLAISRIDESEALKTLAMYRDLIAVEDKEADAGR